MGKISFLLLFLFALPFSNNIQKDIIAKGEAELLCSAYDNIHQLKNEVYLAAVNQALHNTFGSNVSNNYERYTSTEFKGRNLQYYEDIRNNYTNIFPNGEWLIDLEEPIYKQYIDKNGNSWIKCKVKGKAREISSAKVEFIAKTLDGTDQKLNETEKFIEKENLYVYLKSASKGYLMFFYNDLNTVSCILPYYNMKESNLFVEAQKEYIFFSRECADYIEDNSIVDEVELYAESSLDFNLLYIIFSPEKINPPLLNKGDLLEDGYHTHKSLDNNGFNKWLQKQRRYNKELQVQTIAITIKKND